MYSKYIKPHFKNVSEHCVKAETCLYSVAPDWKFLIDFHPDNTNIIIASPCSGHGFKHSAAIGEALSQMAQGIKPSVDLSKFSFKELLQ